MNKLSSSRNIINETYYTESLNDSIESAFKILARDFGDKLTDFEQIHIRDSESPKYTHLLMDDFAEKLDLTLHENKTKLKEATKHSISNHINNLKSLY